MAPTLYGGETSRSVPERVMEYLEVARRGDSKIHIHKHQCIEHRGKTPNFMFKVISQHRAVVSKQVKEAVQTRRRGGSSSILNSRTKLNRCHIPRFVLEEEGKFKKRRGIEDDGNT